jgi:hypothetical protein
VFVASIVGVSQSGDFNNLEKFFKSMMQNSILDNLDMYGEQGVIALEAATPHETGIAAGSWYYTITSAIGGATISWLNSDKDDQGTPIVVLIQYGHGTGTGGYVQAVDFINPVTQEVFDNISDAVWKAVQSA